MAYAWFPLINREAQVLHIPLQQRRIHVTPPLSNRKSPGESSFVSLTHARFAACARTEYSLVHETSYISVTSQLYFLNLNLVYSDHPMEGCHFLCVRCTFDKVNKQSDPCGHVLLMKLCVAIDTLNNSSQQVFQFMHTRVRHSCHICLIAVAEHRLSVMPLISS